MNSKGFTLFEILVVMALIGIVISMGMVIGIDTIARATVFQERDLLVSLLSGARTRALANINESAHGVHIGSADFVVFEGNTFGPSDPHNKPVPREDAVSVTGETDIVFEPLSGDVLDGVGSITLTDNQGKATIEINAFGRIEW